MVSAHALWKASDRVADLGEWEEALVQIMDDVDDELKVVWSGVDVVGRKVLVRLSEGLALYSRSYGGTRGHGE